ncbi:Ketoacyl-synthetase C-terminal extension [Stigmatella aurantiaca]|uniref:Ketoacyl-synthetase C-terminal extension n=1 Tax=Stigmatella aurantiaca TaxID=41 RepID=A0A1H7MQT8_STIAU|nr:beta-ketoacyl synthase N-terminal-like domain-containing protein [Stigmatella aurantiaca]SEL13696.1 Ketoacyl-synthetase C-terminal extension [Stigmatella aurantiaca]
MNPSAESPGRAAMPIAIIGASCLVGSVETPEQLWQHLSSGTPGFSEVPSHRFSWRTYHSNNPAELDKGAVWRGSFLKPLEVPWREYKMGPKMLDELPRSEFYTVEAIRRALENARLHERPFARERTAVILGGAELGLDLRIAHPYLRYMPQLRDALQHALETSGLSEQDRQRLFAEADRALSGISHREVTRGTVAGMSLALGRACALFDLKGPHYMVNAASTSLLAALEHAARGLALGDYDLALVGAASAYLSPASFVSFDRMGMLTREELPRPFDARASGTLLGEGVGFFALRRLGDALEAGDDIHGVIRGISGANQGSPGALLTPPGRAQALAARRAYAQAGYGPESVQLLECHANGVDFLETAELAAMGEVFQGVAPGSVTAGSAKDMAGELHAAAAVPGLIRTLMALKHRELPAQRHVRQLRPELRAEGSPLRVLSKPAAWEAPAQGVPRRASLNALAMGGQAYHLTLEEYVPEFHARLAAKTRKQPERVPVAVVAFGSLTPGAQDSGTFFENILEKKDQIVRVPPERFALERYYDPQRGVGKIYCPLGGFIHGFRFDAEAARLPSSLVPQLDRTHQYALTAAAEAMRTAKISPPAAERTAVFMADMPWRERERELEVRVGYSEMDAGLHQVLVSCGLSEESASRIAGETERKFKEGIAPLSPFSMAGASGSTESSLIAHRYGFKGATGTFESTCASSMAAIGAGVASLQLGETDAVLAGGSFADMTAELYTVNCTFQGLSDKGSRPFDAGASGFIPGEGAGVVVLKRLQDAERDGDRIFAILRGLGASSDGKGKSLLAPSSAGQELAVRQALANAGVQPDSIQYIACHGTATPVGDVTEVTTYSQVLAGRPPGSVAISSVKSMIGHLHSAAGVVNLIKVLKSLEHKVLPPQIHCERPTPDLPWAQLPVAVNTEKRPWPSPENGGPRRAGISAFGMGGTNYHLIVEEYQGRQSPQEAAPHGREEYPLIEEVLERTADSLQAARNLRLDSDPYLREHQVEGVSVLPGSFAMEMMAEASLRLKPGMQVVGMRQIQFHHPAKVWPGRSTRLVVTVQEGKEHAPGPLPLTVQMDMELRPRADLAPIRRKLASATVLLASHPPAPVKVTPATAALFTAAGRSDARKVYNPTHDVFLGPLMQGFRHLRFLEGNQMAAWITQERAGEFFSFTQKPELRVAPLALDSIHHAGGILTYFHHERIALPAGAEALRLHAPLPYGQEICVLCTYLGSTEETARVRVVAFDPKTLQVYAEIDELRFSLHRRIGPALKQLLTAPHG